MPPEGLRPGREVARTAPAAEASKQRLPPKCLEPIEHGRNTQVHLERAPGGYALTDRRYQGRRHHVAVCHRDGRAWRRLLLPQAAAPGSPSPATSEGK